MNLCNNYYSWEKEYETSRGLNNAVDVLEGMLGVENEEAKRCLKGKLERRERRYRVLQRQWRFAEKGTPCDGDVVRYFETFELAHKRNIVWSRSTPRYHTKGKDS